VRDLTDPSSAVALRYRSPIEQSKLPPLKNSVHPMIAPHRSGSGVADPHYLDDRRDSDDRLVSSACRADVDLRCLMRKIIAAGVLALSLAMTTGVGIGNADRIPVEGSYVTQTACLNDGTRFGPNVDAAHLQHWMLYTCEQHNDGLWYLYLIK
jgi:hypothetical protein